MKFLRFTIGLFCLMLIFGYIKYLYTLTLSVDLKHPHIVAFAIGFAVFIPLWLLLIRKARFLLTFEHEFTHLLFNLLFFHKPQKFFASEEEGGYVQTSYGYNFLEYLAPYYFPTLAFLALPFSFFINEVYYGSYLFVVGLMASFHFCSNSNEFITSFRNDETDIAIVGRFFSLIFIPFASIVAFGFIIAFVIGGFAQGLLFIKGGFLCTLQLFLTWTGIFPT